ncbi:hypothetical protein DFH09DRAFT_912859, partial [Mycena vulgaris]
FVTNLLNWGLFGAMAAQMYLYYEAFPNDRLSTKCLVYTVCTVEVVQTVLMTHDASAMFGYGFGDASVLAQLRFFWLTIPVCGGVGMLGPRHCVDIDIISLS